MKAVEILFVIGKEAVVMVEVMSLVGKGKEEKEMMVKMAEETNEERRRRCWWR